MRSGRVRARAAAAGDLLRHADTDGVLRRAGRGQRSPGVRTGGDRRAPGYRTVHGLGKRGRLDEPRRPAHRRTARLGRGGHDDERDSGGDRVRRQAVVRRPVPPRGGAYAAGRGSAAALRVRRVRMRKLVDDALVRGPNRGAHAGPDRRRQGDLRAVGRRGLVGRGGASARGDRRPVGVRFRRHRASAIRRGGAGRANVPRRTGLSPDSCRCHGSVHGGAGRG